MAEKGLWERKGEETEPELKAERGGVQGSGRERRCDEAGKEAAEFLQSGKEVGRRGQLALQRKCVCVWLRLKEQQQVPPVAKSVAFA